jgi:tetratricopeptide (TPR) repeat protein
MWLVLATSGWACAHTGPPEAAAPARGKGDATVVIGPHAMEGGEIGLAAWMLYGMKRAQILGEREGHFHNQSGDDYVIELEARKAMLDLLTAKPSDHPNPELDLLLEVRKAGFLEEYVVTFFAKPGWTIPADAIAALDLPGFMKWGSKRLGGHEPKIGATARPASGQEWPEPPGDKLPDPDELSPKKVPCAASAARLSAALAAWDKEERALDGRPIAAANRSDFLKVLTWAHEQPSYRGQALTWVSPAVLDYQFLLGFCAVDRHDTAAAVEALGKAVRLAPLDANARLELAHALLTAKRFDLADAHIDVVLKTTGSRCGLGQAWRKRGFLLVERGQMEPAYNAYQKSLDYDPGSKIALSEMLLIRREAARLGGPTARAFKELKPPPVGAQVVTQCKDE